MRIDSTGISINPTNPKNIGKGIEADAFYQIVQNKVASKDEYLPSSQKTTDWCETYHNISRTASRKGYDMDSVQTVETNRYLIESDGTNLRIFNKETNIEFWWVPRWDDSVRVDEKTGRKFLINDMGSGLFHLISVDEELERGLKEAFGVDALKERSMTGFTLRQDQKTGIYFVTADGYEGCGGAILFDKEALQKIDALAKEYMKQYPNLAKTYDEAWFYATFEVRGLARRTGNGILMLGKDSLTFKDKDGESGWSLFVEEMVWEMLKQAFDRCPSEELGEKNYWANILGYQNISIATN